MKKLMILTLLVMAGLFVSAQVDMRNQLVRQIAKGDTITSRIYSTYDTYDGTNPILVNYYDSLAFVGSRGVGIGGYTLLYNKLQVNGSQYLGNTVNDTTYLQGRLGINSVGYFSNLVAVGNNTAGATNNMFNFTSGSLNKIRTTYAQAIDTSSFSLSFSVLGKPTLRLNNQAGQKTFGVDSTKIIIGSGTDTLLFNTDTLVDVLTMPYMSGNIANSTTLLDTVFTTYIYGFNNINTGRNTAANTAGTASFIQSGGATSGATDKNGGMMTIKTGLSTGTGMSSVRLQRLNRKATTGTTDNTLADAIIIPSQNNLSDNVAKELFEITLPTDSAVGGHIDFTITATDGDSTQCYTGRVVYAAANFNNTVVTQITEHDAITVDSPAAMTDMTTSWGITSTAGTKISINVTANSGFTPVRMKIYYTIHNGSMETVTQL